jgi:hypothetical protein
MIQIKHNESNRVTWRKNLTAKSKIYCNKTMHFRLLKKRSRKSNLCQQTSKDSEYKFIMIKSVMCESKYRC